MPTAELNPDQLDAVVHAEGPLLIVAGAGSGKTRANMEAFAFKHTYVFMKYPSGIQPYH
jgi:DNA helicase-2/ATP-dependent DNA helicase PcrA